MAENIEQLMLGVGVGPLRFGMTMDEVRAALGEPEEVEISDENDEFNHQAWNYLELGYSLYFDEEDENRLSCIETDRPGLALFGQRLLGKSSVEIKKLMDRNGYPTAEEEQGDAGELQLSYDQEMIDFYFVDNELMVVNFGVFIDETTHAVQWPA